MTKVKYKLMQVEEQLRGICRIAAKDKETHSLFINELHSILIKLSYLISIIASGMAVKFDDTELFNDKYFDNESK